MTRKGAVDAGVPRQRLLTLRGSAVDTNYLPISNSGRHAAMPKHRGIGARMV